MPLYYLTNEQRNTGHCYGARSFGSIIKLKAVRQLPYIIFSLFLVTSIGHRRAKA